MRVPGLGRIRRCLDWIEGNGSGVILLYHRVGELAADPQLLSVTSEHFLQQMEVIRKTAVPISLAALVAGVRQGGLPRRTVAVTFDDGYADNLHNARPILERLETPATVFVTVGLVGSDREFWWDELERLLLQPGRLPERCKLTASGIGVDRTLGASSFYSIEDSRKYSSWMVTEAPPSERHRLYLELHRKIRPLPTTSRQAVLEELRTWAGCGSEGRATHRVMTEPELHALTRDDLVEVGAHTLTHPALSTIPVEDQENEIHQSKALLEGMLERPVTSFAYPYGAAADYAEDSVALVEAAGFESGCSNFPGVVSRRTDRFQLPRVLVRDWSGAEFERRFEESFSG